MKNKKIVISLILLITMFTSCATADFTDRVPAVEKVQFIDHGDNWRNLRYGEIIPVFRSGTTLYMEVYNSVESNELPQELWGKLDAEAMEKEFDAEKVLLNGPRYWVINKMDGGGATKDGKVANFGGIEMTQRAVLKSSIFSGAVGSKAYDEKTVNRSTKYTFWKDNMVYEITNDKGEVYRMQAYSQMTDPELTIDKLEFLGERLNLPNGWIYAARVLEEDSYLISKGSTTIITDELHNTYQKILK
jgi:hypothetical protein